MGVVINPQSELGKELQKWEQFPTRSMDGTVIPAGNPYVFREYPRMLYKAQTFRNGKTLCFGPPVSPFGWRDGNEYQQAILESEAFTKACQRVVRDESEHAIAKGQGWCVSPAEAVEFAEKREQELAREAAEALHAASKMSEKASAEFDAAYDASDVHIADVAAPKKAGPRTKVQV